MRWTPESLAQQSGGNLVVRGDHPIEAAFIDSRRPLAGGLFVPIVAARDGHDYAAAAVAGGATALLKARQRSLASLGSIPGATVVEVDDTLEALTRLAVAARDTIKGPVVAITGSNGKTTTRAYVEAVLRSHYEPVLCTQGNLNNHLGVPLTLLGGPEDAQAAVIELGMSAPGENDHLARIVRPSYGIITSIALEHLEFMGTLEAIAAAEAEVIPHISEGGALVVPSDESALAPHLPRGDSPRLMRVGPGHGGEVRIRSAEVGVRTRALLSYGNSQQLEIALQSFGVHNARNAAAAVAVGLDLGLDPSRMAQALAAVEPVGDRGRLHEFGPHLLIADCYNANPGSMEAALQSLAALRASREGPLVAVLGDMLELGPREAELHREVGRLAASLGIDAVLGFGRLGTQVAEAARKGGIEAEATQDLDAALTWSRARLETAPTAILLKGSRGMALERVAEALLA